MADFYTDPMYAMFHRAQAPINSTTPLSAPITKSQPVSTPLFEASNPYKFTSTPTVNPWDALYEAIEEDKQQARKVQNPVVEDITNAAASEKGKKTRKHKKNRKHGKPAVVTTPVETTPAGKVAEASTPVINEQKASKKHKKESGFQRMEREAAENMGKGSGLKFQEGSGKGKQPSDYAGVHVDQKAHNKKQAEYDKMFADLDKADKEGRKAAVEANRGKKSGVVGAEAKAAIEQNKVNAQADELEKLRKENEKLKADSKNRREKMAQWKKDRQAMKKPADKFQEFSGKKLDTDYAKVADVDPVIHAEKQARYDKLFGKTDDAAKVVDKVDDVADVAKKGKKLGKWGKLGIIAAAVGLAAWGISKLAKKDDAVQPEETTPVVPPTTPEEETTPVTPPVTPVVPPVVPEEEEDTTEKEYEVKKGDNVWNIAKAQLKEELGRIPTNKEIRERTEIIIEKNGLKWEDDNYRVIIQPGQKLNIAA